MDGGLPNPESRRFGFSSISHNGFGVSGSALSRSTRNARSSSPCNGRRTRRTRSGPCFSSSGISVRAAQRSQIEDYEVELNDVWMLQFVIDPDISRGPAVATLESWRLA